MRTTTWVSAAILGAALAAGCAPLTGGGQPTQGVREEVTEIRARVTGVDLPARLVTVVTQDDRPVTIEAGPEVRNLEQVKVGDTVLVRYREAIEARLSPAGTAGQLSSSASVERAEPGQKPGGSVGSAVTATVRIDAVDTVSNRVTFTGLEGRTRTIDVKTPSMQAFLRTLKAGDLVDITYSEALEIRVEPGS